MGNGMHFGMCFFVCFSCFVGLVLLVATTAWPSLQPIVAALRGNRNRAFPLSRCSILCGIFLCTAIGEITLSELAGWDARCASAMIRVLMWVARVKAARLPVLVACARLVGRCLHAVKSRNLDGFALSLQKSHNPITQAR